MTKAVSVGIIGAGPGGIAMGIQLACAGYPFTIFDRGDGFGVDVEVARVFDVDLQSVAAHGANCAEHRAAPAAAQGDDFSQHGIVKWRHHHALVKGGINPHARVADWQKEVVDLAG